MKTTEDLLLVRYRLAGNFQLAAHTPRPVAPNDGLLSVQIHESTLNNTLEQLRLEGKRCELEELYCELAKAFQRPVVEIPEDVPEGVTVQFASRNPISLRCEDNRLAVTINIAELKNHRRKTWRNFTVRAYYTPDASQQDANLVRDGYIQLAGRRLGTLDQIALRGIFTKVLSRNRTFNLINKELVQNPRMCDVRVTHFVVRDGWISVTLGADAQLPLNPPAADEDICAQRPECEPWSSE
jgi:hypothetical protein